MVNCHLTGGGHETHVCCSVSKECRITANKKRLRWSFIPVYECGKVITYSDERRSIAQQTCETKFVRSKISCPLPVRRQLTTFAVSAERWRQQSDQLGRYAHHFTLFWHHISPFYADRALKLNVRETTGHNLWVQWEILWVNAIFVYKFDSFPKSVSSSNWPKFSTLSLIITP